MCDFVDKTFVNLWEFYSSSFSFTFAAIDIKTRISKVAWEFHYLPTSLNLPVLNFFFQKLGTSHLKHIAQRHDLEVKTKYFGQFFLQYICRSSQTINKNLHYPSNYIVTRSQSLSLMKVFFCQKK